MPVPTSINDLSTTAASNSPNGAVDAPSSLDDHIRAHGAFIAQLRDGAYNGADAVKLTGDQSIAGTKTFSSPIVGSITGNAATATTAANVSRSVTGAGLATGGGALSADRTITVAKATQAQAEAGTDDATAMTPLRVKQAQIRTGAVVATTAGTSVDLVGIPGFAKRVSVHLNGVSTSGTSLPRLVLGTSAGFVSSGYVATVVAAQAAGSAVGIASDAFPLDTSNTATYVRHGIVTFSRASTSDHRWTCGGDTNEATVNRQTRTAGQVDLGLALDRVRLTTAGGVDTFNAGSISITWE